MSRGTSRKHSVVPKESDQERQAIITRLVSAIEAERRKQQLSLNAVATSSGLSHTMVMRVEKKERTPTIDTLLRIAAALDVDLWKLLRDATKASGN